MLDGENITVYETTIPVKDIKPDATYTVKMDHTVTIPKGVTCCLALNCSNGSRPYATLPTLNTTNRTDPNLTLSTLNMRTQKKSLTISYTYYYRLLLPFIVMILEFVVLFVLCFELSQNTHLVCAKDTTNCSVDPTNPAKRSKRD